MNTFITPIIERNPCTTTHGIEDYGKASHGTRKLMIEGSHTAQIFFIDIDGCFLGGLRPALTYAGSNLQHIEVNLSNKNFAPDKLPKKILQHVLIVAPTDDVPDFKVTVGINEIPGTYLDGLCGKRLI